MSYIDTFTVMGAGMGVVFSTLVLLFFFMVLLGRISSALDGAKARRAAKGAPDREVKAPLSPPTGASVGTDPVTIAIVSAAVNQALGGRRARILSVKYLERWPGVSTWGNQGRLDIMNTHNE